MEFFVQALILLWSLATLMFAIFMVILLAVKYRKEKCDNFNLTEEDLSFLLDLQHEMLTQDTVCQAAPRFWTVAGSKKVYTDELNSEGEELINDGEICASGIDEAIEYFKDLINGQFDEYDNYRLETEQEKTKPYKSYCIKQIDITVDTNADGYTEGDEIVNVQSYIETIRELIDALEEFELIDEEEYAVGYHTTEHHVYPDTMFLTNRSCKEHIEKNHYHYDEKAHSYAMTAWRSPEVERLWAILDKINWKSIKETIYE